MIQPYAIAVGGGYLYVESGWCAKWSPCTNFVSQFSAASGAFIRTIQGRTHGWGSQPATALAARGGILWVLGRKLAEIRASDGALIRSVAYGGRALCVDAAHVWVVDYGSDVAEVRVATGALVRYITKPASAFPSPAAIASDGTHVWVEGMDTLTELLASNGSVVRVIKHEGTTDYWDPESLALDGKNVWVSFYNGLLEEFNANSGASVAKRKLSSVNNTNAGVVVASNIAWVLEGQGVTAFRVDDGSQLWTITGSLHGFSGPQGLASDGTHVWVTNTTGNTVTELDAATRQPVRQIAGPQYQFDEPAGIATDGVNVWVVNTRSDDETASVTEFSAITGQLVRIFDDPSLRFYETGPIEVTGGYVWIGSWDAITELDAATGAVVRIIDSTGGQSSSTSAVAVGADVWMLRGATVTEFNTATGTIVRVVPFLSGFSLTSDGAHLWILSAQNTLTEIRESNGAVMRTIQGARFGLVLAQAVVAGGGHVWIANGCPYNDCSSSIAELSSSTGQLAQVLAGSRYAINDPFGLLLVGGDVWTTNALQQSLTVFSST
jgi:hypothetical protein